MARARRRLRRAPSSRPRGLRLASRIGVDVGGTFTDLAYIADDTGLVTTKVPTRPDDPAAGVLDAVASLAGLIGVESSTVLARCVSFVHGTTIGTNALLARNGPRLGLLATAGFRDTLAMRRGHRDNVWDFRGADPPPLVPRSLRLPVRERIGPDGAVLAPLCEDDVTAAVEAFRSAGVEAVAVGFLFSFLNPVHERRAAELLRIALPNAFVSASHEVAPIIGEYERLATTVVNAYLGPPVGRYLEDLDRRLRDAGLMVPLLLAQSNGGVADVERCRRLPAALALSGPAAGIAAASAFAGWLRTPDLISADMGGTSFDVAVVADGRPTSRLTTDVAGQHLALPMLDVHTIGTGGGSIARVDAGGVLHVGPDGAGARPGPACYGLGGARATVTDANLALGRLAPDRFFGGRMPLDTDAARRALDTEVAGPLSLDVSAAARGVIAVATAQMADAIRLMTVERGLDPRGFALLAAGGAAALHACELARALGIARAIVPHAAGVFCALGMLSANLTFDSAAPLYGTFEGLDVETLSALVERLARDGVDRLARLGVAADRVDRHAWLEARYAGRHRELPLPLPSRLEANAAVSLRAAFDGLAAERFGRADPDAEVEFVGVRVSVVGRAPTISLTVAQASGAEPTPNGARPIVFGSPEPVLTPVYDGANLGPGDVIEGAAVVEDSATTTLLWAGDRLVVDALGGYQIAVAGLGDV